MLSAAEPADLKTFAAEESYVVEGASIVLTQKMGEATVKVGPALRDSSTLTAANGAKFDLERELPNRVNIYKMQSAGTLADSKSALDSLNQDANIEYAYPVYANAANGKRHFLNDEVAVHLKGSFDPGQTDLATAYSLELIDTLSARENIYVFRLTQPKNFNPFQVCHALLQRAEVVWAEPNMGQEVQQFVIPNDTSFASEWNLRNTGQSLAFTDADVDADEAWDGSQGYGSAGIRIAILDDGVQTAHPDLAANIVQGYDFFGSDTDPNPVNANDNHGTAVAGVAAAAVNNSAGIAGAAGKCKILPVRIIENGVAVSATSVYKALVYAADNADVINCSWGTSPSSTITSGLSYGYNSGRGGKGCAILCSSGNSAAGEGPQSYDTSITYDIYAALGGAAGNYFIGFQYEKNAALSAGDDTVWLADITLPNSTRERLDSATLPAGWQFYGSANWTSSIDPAQAHGTTRYAWRAGVIGDNQGSGIATTLQTIDSTHRYVTLRRWVSSDSGDNFHIGIFDSSGTYLGFINIDDSGVVQNRTTAVSYPANLSAVLAVGASTDFDYRSHYSQYDSTLAFVASSSGGYGGVMTTDRTGTAGYDPTDYTSTFGGTSASAPLAAGIAALVLSKDGNLTRATVASKLNENCDKVGPVTYSGTPPLTRNDYYGYGRLNAKSSVNATTADTTAPTFTAAQTIHYRAVDVTFSEPMGEGAEDPTKYQIIAGAGTLSLNPSRVIRILPTVYRLVWTSGDMATSGTVTIKALGGASGVKDVAGNYMANDTTQNTTGTKRVLGINCGNRLDGIQFQYTPPYVADNGFQGNESLPLLTSQTPIVSTSSNIDLSGVTDPAPVAVYQATRSSWYNGSYIQHAIHNFPNGTYTVRLHFAQLYFSNVGDEVFDIRLNGSLAYSGFDILAHTGGQKYKAYIATFTNVNPYEGDTMIVELDPVLGSSGWYNASICGIEILKP